MGEISIKQLLKFFAVITLVAALFIVGAYLFLRWGVNIEVPGEKPRQTPPKIQEPAEAELTPQVIYDGQAFRPARVLRDGSGSVGCLVVLANRSIVPLRIGLSQRSTGGDSGSTYGIVAPGDKLIFDPRFVGITRLRFYNQANPQQDFFVELGPKCQL